MDVSRPSATAGNRFPALGGSGRLLGWSAVGCAACCAAPLIGLLGGATLGAALRSSAGAVLVIVAAGAVGVVLYRRRTRGQPGTSNGRSAAVCSLPQADRRQRTQDFRALFAGTLLDRRRDAEGVSWTLSATDRTDQESHRLAALEERCCDGIRIGITRGAERITWRITGPPSAARTLDAFYELPVLVGDDVRARELWARLDGAGCGGNA